MCPLIGIPQCLDERGRWRRGRHYQYLDVAYARAVENAGGSPVYLPLQDDAETLTNRLDGLLLPGGDDLLPPQPYPAGVRFEPTPESQLGFDRRLLAAAAARDLPVLAICYGMQLLTLEDGGRLLYDIASDEPAAAEHRLPEADGRHVVRIEPDSLLARALGSEREPVNSLHHQGVADAGRLRVTARAEDGVIEAVEAPERRFSLGVQWHPEKLGDDHRQRIFGAFIGACRP